MLPIYQYIYWLVVGDTRFPPDNSEKHKYNFRKIHLWLIENVSIIIDQLLMTYYWVIYVLILIYYWVTNELLMSYWWILMSYYSIIYEVLISHYWVIAKLLVSYWWVMSELSQCYNWEVTAGLVDVAVHWWTRPSL